MTKLNKFDCLNQAHYGGKQDCTLTSITAIINYYGKIKPMFETINIKDIYTVVELIAKKYGYNSDKGTNPLMNGKIFREAAECVYDIDICTYGKYLKGLGWNWDTVKKSLDVGNPVILSLWKCGKYKNHTVTIIGYDEVKKQFIINDNWGTKEVAINYSDISFISSVTAVSKFR